MERRCNISDHFLMFQGQGRQFFQQDLSLIAIKKIQARDQHFIVNKLQDAVVLFNNDSLVSSIVFFGL